MPLVPLSEQSLEFLFENRLQNNKEWHKAHKTEYQELVVKPLQQLAERLLPTVLEIDPRIPHDPRKAISRIRRDIRFTKDKTLYRDVMWCVFSPDREQVPDAPAFFFEFSPRMFRYGCGYYHASAKVMEAVREMILESDPLFRKANHFLAEQELFNLEGELYKRTHYPMQPEQLRDWLERRNVFVIHESQDSALLFSESLHKTLAEGFQALEPVYHFLCAASQRAHERELHHHE